ncbi:hypothetical protein FQR65_LT00683 [Abscondita terminalis]|nr:hypothetical protein FQR65_LT00683 [Abscondita terminalis]
MMSLKQHSVRTNNENLLGRQKKLDAPKTHTIQRPILGEVEKNTFQTSITTKKAASQNVDSKKPVANHKTLTTKSTALQNVNIKKKTASKYQLNTNKLPEPKITVTHVDDDENLDNQLIAEIDKKDRGDVFLVPEYVQDIFHYLCKYEQNCIIRKNYLASHKSTPRMRSVLVNWIVEVHESFKMTLETLHMSVAILDRYLQLNNNIGKQNLQLVGITSILIAAKYEEMYLPPLTDFAEISDNFFSCADIKKMELDVLSTLGFKLGRPLSLQFLRRYNKIGNVSPEHHYLAKYLLEIFLLQYELCHVNPSLQAAAACCLSLSILNEVSDPRIVWTKTLVCCSSYKYVDIKSTVINLAYYLHKIESSKFLAIKEKYSKTSNRKISKHAQLKGPLITKLVHQYHQKVSD